MRVMFPQHIKKWFFSGAAFSIMGFSISFIQLIILAIWIVCALGTFSALSNSWSKWAWLLAFIAKKVRDSFFDVPKKFHVNYTKDNPTEIVIAKAKQEKWKQRIEIKGDLDIERLSQIDKWWIL